MLVGEERDFVVLVLLDDGLAVPPAELVEDSCVLGFIGKFELVSVWWLAVEVS